MAYYTYKPGTHGSKLKLLPGQTLGFAPGKGYYAKPGGAAAPYPGGGPAEPKPGAGNPYAVPRRPAPPPQRPPTPPPAAADPYAALSQDEIDKRAGELAQSQLDPQQAEIRRQQALAATQATNEEDKSIGLTKAAAELLKTVGPEALQGFLDASKEEGALGQGLATGASKDVADRVAADQAFAQSQGQSGGSNVDTAALHDTVYGLNGEIPGNSFAEQGAAMNQWGLQQPVIALDAGREQLDQRMAQARQDNDQYAQQLIQLAAQYPGLKAQALQQLNQYELDKANYRQSVRTNDANIASQQRQDALAARSEAAQERAAGLTAAKANADYAYKYAALRLRSQEDKTKLAQATREGKRIDSAASRVVGHVVYRDGTEDPSIKVQQSGQNTAQGKAIVNREKDTSKARVTAFKTATALRGKPSISKTFGQIGGTKGKYIASPKFKAIPQGKPGAVYIDGSTNNLKRADYTGGGAANYADAQQKVWATIDGDGLMSRYGYSREQVMKFVNDALARAGWKRK